MDLTPKPLAILGNDFTLKLVTSISADRDSTLTLAKSPDLTKEASPRTQADPEVALLTGCQDRSYALGLAMALSAKCMQIDVIGNNWVDSAEFHTTPNLNFLNLGGIQDPSARFSKKLFELLGYYARLIRYITIGKPKLLHILWNSKFEYFDRTLLMVYCKLCGKKIVLTAHNVNRAKRDSTDSLLNRLTLHIQYRLVDHIFVHTDKMKKELLEDFSVGTEAVTRIPFGLNIAVSSTTLTPAAAKLKLGIDPAEKAILFFGRIAPYKGLEYLLTAFQMISSAKTNYRLIIAGEPMKGYEEYIGKINQIIHQGGHTDRIVRRLEFIPDADTELYFKAADVLVLPYKDIFQSGVLFLGYAFGLPAIAADVGSFKEDIVQGETGFLYRPGNPASLGETIQKFFASDLYRNLNTRRHEIRNHASAGHSWDTVSELTRNAYERLAARNAG
jgi:D-inositol-3-phosphate glycosyltransferase